MTIFLIHIIWKKEALQIRTAPFVCQFWTFAEDAPMFWFFCFHIVDTAPTFDPTGRKSYTKACEKFSAVPSSAVLQQIQRSEMLLMHRCLGPRVSSDTTEDFSLINAVGSSWAVQQTWLVLGISFFPNELNIWKWFASNYHPVLLVLFCRSRIDMCSSGLRLKTWLAGFQHTKLQSSLCENT